MPRPITLIVAIAFAILNLESTGRADPIMAAGEPGRLDIRQAGEHSVRVTLMPVDAGMEFPFTPALAEREYPEPGIRLREIDDPVGARFGSLKVEVMSSPLTVMVADASSGELLQRIVFEEKGGLAFKKSDRPVLGLGEGGPQPAPRGDWREQPVQFDRNGALHPMIPRWESGAYGSRNPVPFMIGAEGWGLFVATPWGEIDLREKDRGILTPWRPPSASEESIPEGERSRDLDGQFTWTHLKWEEAARRLTLEREAGDWKPGRKKLVIRLLPEGLTKEIEYDGGRTEVNFGL